MIRKLFPFIIVARAIHADCEALWDLITDTTRWLEWGPSISQVRCQDRHLQKGSRGHVRTVLGFWAPFIISEWEDGCYWSWRVFGIRATGHRVESIGPTQSRLVFEVPIYAAPYAIICFLAAKRIAHILEKS